jgi:RNA polymerase sigma-70 factor (sigma-E family)
MLVDTRGGAAKDVAEARAFEVYMNAIRSRLHRDAYRLCGDWHEAEDLVQMTLYKVYRRWEHLSARDLLGGYTNQALLRTYISEHRRQRWTYEVSQADLPEQWVEAAPNHDHVELLIAISHLGPRQRAVITLRFWHDLSVEQVAVLLGCTPGNVTSQTHRALARLRTVLTGRRP